MFAAKEQKFLRRLCAEGFTSCRRFYLRPSERDAQPHQHDISHDVRARRPAAQTAETTTRFARLHQPTLNADKASKQSARYNSNLPNQLIEQKQNAKQGLNTYQTQRQHGCRFRRDETEQVHHRQRKYLRI